LEINENTLLKGMLLVYRENQLYTQHSTKKRCPSNQCARFQTFDTEEEGIKIYIAELYQRNVFQTTYKNRKRRERFVRSVQVELIVVRGKPNKNIKVCLAVSFFLLGVGFHNRLDCW
jgi:hypothetical protein